MVSFWCLVSQGQYVLSLEPHPSVVLVVKTFLKLNVSQSDYMH